MPKITRVPTNNKEKHETNLQVYLKYKNEKSILYVQSDITSQRLPTKTFNKS